MLTQERLKEVLDYNPETGLFYLKSMIQKSKFKVGDVIGRTNGKGYVILTIDSLCYRAHRVAWFYTYGEWPIGMIDHINGVKDDNRLVNLRDVSASVNSQNIKTSKSNNKLSKLGVFKHRKKFQAQIMVEGKQLYLGTFNTLEEAHNAYLAAKRQHHVGNTL